MNSTSRPKLLVVQVAALGYELLQRSGETKWGNLTFHPMETVFPALTCPVQASFRTAGTPSQHGMVANGLYSRALRRPFFWDQSSALVSGGRIWDRFRSAGRRVAMLFWQQSMGECVDMILSPAPIHKHHGGMIQDCYSKPQDLYARVRRVLGRPFNLAHYWGPLASAKASQWIADATCWVLEEPSLAPDLCLTYLPVLDYDLQRWGPDHHKAFRAMHALRKQVEQLRATCARQGYDLLVFGDYAMADSPGGALFPNRALREAGLLAVRNIGGMLYPDFAESRAVAVVDHEIAHVYIRDAGDWAAARAVLSAVPGVGNMMDEGEQRRAGVSHSESGELLLTSGPGHWLAYPWWHKKAEAPDYAGHVDIHNKPGYDPCELFFGWPPGSVSRNTDRVKGSHGLTRQDRRVCWASTFLDMQPESLTDLASSVQHWLEGAI